MNPTMKRGALAAIAAAIDADLERQVATDRGVNYRPGRDDDCGVAIAHMNIRIVEVARAAFDALAEILAFECTRFPSMEAKAVEWACRISGPADQPPFHPDPVGILLMCEEIAAAGLEDMWRLASPAAAHFVGGHDADR